MVNVPIDFLRENPKRYKQLARGENVDYAPFRLWLDQTFVCDYAKVNPAKYATDLETMFEAQKIVNDRFYDLRDYEVNVGFMDIYFDFEKFSSENSAVTPCRVLEATLDNFDKYCQRKKIADVAGMQKMVDGVEYFNKKLPKNKYASFYHGCTGAMDLFSIFRGTEKFFMDLYDYPEKVKRIFEFLTEKNLELLEFQQKMWGGYNTENNLFDKIDIGEDYCAYVPPELFDEFVKPYTGKLVEAWKGKVVCSLHTDGDILPTGIHKLGELGIDELMGFSPNLDIKLYREALPGIILGGNIHPINVMIEGTPEDVKEAARYCFETASANQKFVLCTGGAISAGAREENVDAFLEACYEVVKYDLAVA